MIGNRRDNSKDTGVTDRDPMTVSRREFIEQSVGMALTVGVIPACSGDNDKASTQGAVSDSGGTASAQAGSGGSALASRSGGSGGRASTTSVSAGGSGGAAASSNAGAPANVGSSGGATSLTGNGGAASQSGAAGQQQLGSGGSPNASGGLGGTSPSGGTGNGATSAGGRSIGGGASSVGGGAGTGGAKATGGSVSATAGKSAVGGSSTGGSASGTGGKPGAGGSVTGGSATGGSATGGSATGGSGGSSSTALVGIVRNSTVATAVADAVAIAGGIPSLSGQTVLIKPNVVWARPSPYTTAASVVAALIDLVKARGAARIIVADRSDTTMSTTASSFAVDGIDAVVAAAGAELVDLQAQGYTVTNPAGATSWPQGIPYSKTLLSGIDYIINVPCCKDHLLANYTAAIKNWMGIIDLDVNRYDYGRYFAHGNSPADMGARLPELHLGVREDLVVMDATKICLTGGPFGPGQTAAPGIIVASKDPIAVDVTALCLLKHYLKVGSVSNAYIDNFTVWSQPQIVRALQIGIGISSKQGFNYLAQGVSEISTIMSYL